MEEVQGSSPEQDNVAGNVMDSLGVDSNDSNQSESSSDQKNNSQDLPAYAKERMGRQEKKHQREIRELRNQIQALQQSRQQAPSSSDFEQPMNPYTQQNIQPGSVEEQIHKMVAAQLAAQQRQLAASQNAAHIQKQYQDLQNNLNNASDKYEDFDDVVRSSDVPFTESMRDTALLLPNAADVLYKLGKNKNELKRISELHPLDQAKEMIRLSAALSGANQTPNSAPKVIGQIKNNPVASSQVTDTTPVAELRKKMKANWK